MIDLSLTVAPLIDANLLKTAVYHPNHGLFLIIVDDAPWQAVRQLWQPAPNLAEIPLRVAPQAMMEPYLDLRPEVTADLSAETAVLLHGAPIPVLNSFSSTVRQAARLAQQAMQASQALTPQLMPADEASRCAQLLARLSGQPNSTAVDQFCQLQATLQAQLFALASNTALPMSQLPTSVPLPPPTLPTLRAIYRRERGETCFVFEPLEAAHIRALDWAALTEDLQKRGSGLQLTTSRQLMLAAAYEMPLDLTLQRIRHEWGIDYLKGLAVDKTAVYQSAATLPAKIYVEEFAPAVLNSTTNENNRLIHDYQNKLFNVRLVGELLARTFDQESRTPPPLPDREISTTARFTAIFGQLHWWLTQFLNQTIN